MKFERTFRYRGNHAIVFNVSQITLTDSERPRLRELHYGEAVIVSCPERRKWIS